MNQQQMNGRAARDLAGRPVVAIEEYQEMKAQDAAYQAALVGAYGTNAANARYLGVHKDPCVQAARDAFLEASDDWWHATRAANGKG